MEEWWKKLGVTDNIRPRRETLKSFEKEGKKERKRNRHD